RRRHVGVASERLRFEGCLRETGGCLSARFSLRRERGGDARNRQSRSSAESVKSQIDKMDDGFYKTAPVGKTGANYRSKI
ncbi:MAG: hypothetical protein KDJ54_12215, partial [Candidatus Competibacteraceae bacterium]|nr:hypothetical protein [Candidatus Competibacteraceae bacterium]